MSKLVTQGGSNPANDTSDAFANLCNRVMSWTLVSISRDKIIQPFTCPR